MPKKIGTTWQINPNLPIAIQLLKRHPYFGFAAKAESSPVVLKKAQGKEILFYSMVGLLLIFAFLKQAFAKYFNDLFRLFFRTTLKYRQIREQLMQVNSKEALAFKSNSQSQNVFWIDAGSTRYHCACPQPRQD